MLRRLIALCSIAATAAAGLIAVQTLDPNASPQAQAASASDFNPGNLISDELFYDGSAMTAAEVQDFLASKVAPSEGTSNALVNYTQATPSMPATSYCDAYVGAPGGESAASIIAKVGEACHISQKALLVLLEKEQSLVSDSYPSSRQLSAATGFGCPDTAPCDSSYGGFFYQVYNAGRQFQNYKANPYNYNHIPFQTNNILYNPDFGCGSSPVYIENSATAGLYNYTPYQPNAAALRNLYGEGDGCSAYGNRNFWRMYTDWFGDAHAAPVKELPALVQAEGSDAVFLLAEGKRYYVPAAMAEHLAPLFPIETISQQHLDWTPWGPWVSHLVVNPEGEPSFLVDGSQYPTDCAMAAEFGLACDGAATMLDRDLAKFESPGHLTSFITTPKGLTFLVQGGVKREVPSLEQLTAMGYYTETSEFPDGALDYLPTGEPVAGWGVVTSDVDASTRAFLDGMTSYPLSATVSGFPYLAPSATMTGTSIAKYQQGATITGLVTTGAKTYLVTDKGLARVDAAAYGSTPAAKVSDSLVADLPQLPAISGAHLIQALGSNQVALVENGARTMYPSAQAAQDAAKAKGLSTAISVTTADLVGSIPVAPESTPTPTATPTTAAPTTTAPAATTPAATAPATSAPAMTEPAATAPATTAPAETATPTATPTPTAEPIQPLSNGQIIADANRTGIWLVNGDRLLQIATPAVAAGLGLDVSAPTTVNQATLASYVGRFDALYTPSVTCGEAAYLGLGGELVPYASEELRAAYGLQAPALDPTVCATLQVSATRTIDTAEVVGPNGERYTAAAGVLTPVTATAEPTATASATAEATATATAEPTAAESAEPTATATESATPTVTATASASPSATPAAKPVELPASIISIMPKAKVLHA